jgi:hypothetical protein
MPDTLSDPSLNFTPPAFLFFSANAHLAHWQAAQAEPHTQACQRAKFSPPARTGIQKKIVNLTKNVQIGFSRKIRK